MEIAPDAAEKTPELSFGYTVGLKSDGRLHFELLGGETGVIELMGLHAYAGKRVDGLVEASANQGNTAIIRAVNKLTDITLDSFKALIQVLAHDKK